MELRFGMSLRPILLVMFGYPGSGKTYFSERLAKHEGFVHLNADRTRLMIFTEPKYTLEEHRVVFRFMDYLAKEFLQHGVSVIYDANFNFRKSRRGMEKLASKVGATYRLVCIKTEEEKALKRLGKRAKVKDAKKKEIYRPIDQKVFMQLKSQMEMPMKSEKVIAIDGHSTFSEQLKSFHKQLDKTK